MSTGDWIAFAGLLPLMLAVGWIQTFRVWRRHADVSAGVSWFTGKAGIAGYHSFLLPAAVAFTLMGVSILLDLAPDQEFDPASVGSPTAWLMGIGFLMLLLGFWMWLFAWPRFLVPPHLRGQPGWVGASWREWRTRRRERKQARAYARQRAGNRAAR